VAWTTRLYQHFNNETAGGLPSGWTWTPQEYHFQPEWWYRYPGTCTITQPGLSGSSGCATIDNNSNAGAVEHCYKGFTIGADDTQVKASCYYANTFTYGSMDVGCSNSFSVTDSSGTEIAGLYFYYVREFFSEGDPWFELGVPSGGYGYYKLREVVDTSEYYCTLSLNLGDGVYSVIIDGVTYDNGGVGYPLLAATTPARVKYAINTWGNGTTSKFDEVKVESNSGPGGGLEAWIEPITYDGDNGWYKCRPYPYITCSGTTADYWKSVGTINNQTAYVALSSGVASGEPSSIYTSGQVEGWNTSSGAYIFYGTTSAAADMARMPVKWTEDVPIGGTISLVTTSSNSAIFGGYLSKSGYIKLSGIRGHASGMTAPQEHIGIAYIDVYCGSDSVAHVDVIGGSPPISSIPSGQVYYTQRKSIIPVTVPFLWAAAPGGDPSDYDHYLYQIDIPFNSDDITSKGGSIFAIVTSEAGFSSKSTSTYFTRTEGIPVIDRLLSYESASSGTGEKRIIGHVNHQIPIDRVEYTTDRRVPVLAVPVSGGSLLTADGEPPMEYTSGLSFVAGPFTEESAESNKAVGVFGKPSSYLTYPVDNFPFYKGTFETYFKGNYGASSGTDSWSASGGVKTVFDVSREADSNNRIRGEIEHGIALSGLIGDWIFYETGDGYGNYIDRITSTSATVTMSSTAQYIHDGTMKTVPTSMVPGSERVDGGSSGDAGILEPMRNNYFLRSFVLGSTELDAWSTSALSATLRGSSHGIYSTARGVSLSAGVSDGSFYQSAAVTQYVDRTVSFFVWKDDGTPVTSADCQVCHLPTTGAPTSGAKTTLFFPVSGVSVGGNQVYRAHGYYTPTTGGVTNSRGLVIKAGKTVNADLFGDEYSGAATAHCRWPSSYIPTTTVAVSRSYGSTSIPWADDVSLAATIFVVETSPSLIALSGGITSYTFGWYLNATNYIRIQQTGASTSVAGTVRSTAGTYTATKASATWPRVVALSWTSGAPVEIYVDGVKGTDSANCLPPSGMASANIGSVGSAGSYAGGIQRVLIHGPGALTSGQIAYISNRLRLGPNPPEPGEAYLDLNITDSFGTTSNCRTSGLTVSNLVDNWNHLKFSWNLGKPLESSAKVVYNNSLSGFLSGVAIPFDLGFIGAEHNVAVSGNSFLYDQYNPLCIGDVASGSTPMRAAKGYFADVRVSDVEVAGPQYPKTYYGGWTTSGVSFSSGSSDFAISVPGSDVTDSEAVVKVRAVDAAGNRRESAFFNTSASKPVLLRGAYSGTSGFTNTIYRFRLIDSQGVFDDVQFTINPTGYKDKADERVVDNLSISGRRELLLSPKPQQSVSFDWENITRVFMLKLKERSDSGNSFFLIDHNDRVMYGKFVVENYDEIVATVPSRYRVSAEFIGQGED
jgi:hypothetical protein